MFQYRFCSKKKNWVWNNLSVLLGKSDVGLKRDELFYREGLKNSSTLIRSLSYRYSLACRNTEKECERIKEDGLVTKKSGSHKGENEYRMIDCSLASQKKCKGHPVKSLWSKIKT